MPNNPAIAIIILAAGGSSRLGKPKQLLSYQNTTLIEHAIKTALAANAKHVILVTGAAHEQVAAQIKLTGAVVIENKNWQSGMASSIRAGLHTLRDKNINGVVVMLCDQPLITSMHLNLLTDCFMQNDCDKIVATSYENIAGVPAIFPKTLFPDLLNLKGDEGARQLIKSKGKDVTAVAFEDAFLDVDTTADYEKLMAILANANH